MSKMGQHVYENQTLWDECYASELSWDEFRARCKEVARKQGLPETYTCSFKEAWRILAEMKREKAINEGK